MCHLDAYEVPIHDQDVLQAADRRAGRDAARLVAGRAQQGGAAKPEAPRASTGGAQTLEDILARQRGEKLDDDFRREAIGDPAKAAGIAAQLGTLGGASDSEVFRALRYGSADVTVSARGPAMDIIIQDSGMWWLELRKGPLLNGAGGCWWR